eukprot:8182332-Karenia_brevis.AAC.1
MEPTPFMQGAWVRYISGVLVTPTTVLGTCRQQGAHNVYDYFYVHPSLEPCIVGVEVMEEWPSSPHKP